MSPLSELAQVCHVQRLLVLLRKIAKPIQTLSKKLQPDTNAAIEELLQVEV
jgi:hypothetical protein